MPFSTTWAKLMSDPSLKEPTRPFSHGEVGTARSAGSDAAAAAEIRAPALAAILWTPDDYETIRKTVRALKAQTVQHKVELILLGPTPESLEIDESDVEGFASYKLVVLDSMAKSSAIRAAGTWAATAPIVSYMQDHAFPVPGWAEALLECYEGPWSGASFVFANDNPATATSWCNFLMQYGDWVEPLPPGEPTHIGGHMASYRRDALMEYGDELPRKLETSVAMHWEMKKRGCRFAIAPGAVVYHQNYSRLLPSMPLRFQTGRLFAANRTRGWSLPRRLLYAAASPLIPLLRFSRMIRTVSRIGGTSLLPRIVPVGVLLMISDGLGQAWGSLAGRGGAMEWITNIEWHRHRFMVDGELSAFSNTPADSIQAEGMVR